MKHIFLICIVSCFTVEFVQGAKASKKSEQKAFLAGITQEIAATLGKVTSKDMTDQGRQALENAIKEIENASPVSSAASVEVPVSPAKAVTSANQSALTPVISSRSETSVTRSASPSAEGPASPVGPASNQSPSATAQLAPAVPAAALKTSGSIAAVQTSVAAAAGVALTAGAAIQKQKWEKTKEALVQANPELGDVDYGMSSGPEGIFSKTNVLPRMNLGQGLPSQDQLPTHKQWMTKLEAKKSGANKNVTTTSATNVENSAVNNQPVKSSEVISKTGQNDLQPTQRSWFTLPNVGLVAGAAALAAGSYWLYKKYYEYQANSMNVAFRKQLYDGKNNEMIDKAFYLWPELYAFPPSDCKKIMPAMLTVAHKMGMVIDKLGMNNSVTVEFGTLVRDLLINYRTVGLAKTTAALTEVVKL